MPTSLKPEVRDALDNFVSIDDAGRKNKISSKGSLALVVELTRAFKGRNLPLNWKDFVTPGGGQVSCASGQFIKKILAEHGINQLLSKEGGRTSRGSLHIMKSYVALINKLGDVDLDAVEEYWVERVRKFLAGKPFKLSSDRSRSVANSVDDLFEQAAKRQCENPGMQYAGSVLQHLVAAKLELIMPGIEIHGAAEADDQTGREGDFIIEDTAIHCTTAPAQALIDKCAANVGHGLTPIIITISSRTQTAKNLLDDAGIGDRAEVWDLQQFLSTNVYEHGLFTSSSRRLFLGKLVVEYNGIVDKYETDPSLKIEYDSGKKE